MARSVVLTAAPSRSLDVLRTTGATLTLLLLGAFIASPVGAVVAHSLRAPGTGWPVGLALDSVGIGVASTLSTLVPAMLVAGTLTRVPVSGRALLWRVVRSSVLIPSFIAPLALLTLGGPGGLLFPGALRPGFGAIVAGQAIAFLPFAVAWLVRALGAAPVELEQAAEILGASRLTVLRRVTLGLIAPGVGRTALAVFGLCLADVATPLLLGGDHRVLTTAIVAAVGNLDSAARAALALVVLVTAVALAGCLWRDTGIVTHAWPDLPRLDRRASSAGRWSLGVAAWAVALAPALAAALVVLGSLGQWPALGDRGTLVALAHSVLLGLGAALAGTALALAAAWLVERRRVRGGRIADVLVRVPVAVPGIAAGVGYGLLLGTVSGRSAGGWLVGVPIVACWELPVTTLVARTALGGTDRSVEEAAVSLGASGGTTLARIVAPLLRPAAGWIFADLFAGGVLAVGTVVLLVGPGRSPGAITMLALAAAGALGAACAVATALLAVASGALVVGRAIAGRQRGSTLLA